MLKRTLTAIVALIVFGAVIGMSVMWGEFPMYIAIGLVSLFMLHELYGAMTKEKYVKYCGYMCAVLMILGAPLGLTKFTLCAAMVIAMMFAVFMHGKAHFKDVLSAAFVSIYVPVFMMYIVRSMSEFGPAVMAIVFVIAWGSDTAAYFCGTFFGKHKLIPHVSPKKTVEGSVGAVICTALLCMLYVFIMHNFGVPMKRFGSGASAYGLVAAMGVVGCILSQFGDLAASAIKRDAGIKDFGSIFPGHGGFMDRFDSVLIIAPVVYYFPAVCYVVYNLVK